MTHTFITNLNQTYTLTYFLNSIVQKALDDNSVQVGGSASESSPDAPLVDLCGEHKITLTLNMCGGVWKPAFVYPLTPVGVDHIDVLEAKVRDLQDEVEVFKQQREEMELEMKEVLLNRTYLSLASSVVCPHNQCVDWRAEFGQKSLPENKFTLSNDGKQVTVLEAGLYQAHVRLCGTGSSNGQFLKLQLNGAVVATCHQSNGHQDTAQLQEILSLSAGDVLQVQSHFNGNSLNIATGNRFSLLRMGN